MLLSASDNSSLMLARALGARLLSRSHSASASVSALPASLITLTTPNWANRSALIRSPHRSNSVARQSDIDVGHDESGISRGDDEITCQRQREAGASCGAFDRGDNWFRKSPNGFDPVMQAVDTARLVVGGELSIGLKALQVAAGAENGSLPGHDHRTDFRVGLRRAERFDTRRIDLGPQGISVFGIADGQDHGPAFRGALQFGCHGLSPRCARAKVPRHPGAAARG